MPKFLLSLIFAYIFTIPTHGQTQSNTLNISPLIGDFYIYTTYGTFKGNIVPSNSMYVVTQNGIILIDTPWDEAQTIPLLDSIEKRHQQKVNLCVVTHHHADRTAGLKILREKGIKTYSTEKTLKLCKQRNEKQAQFSFKQDTTFQVSNISFQAFYPGEGHTSDNIVIWFPEEKILYGGCFIKSIEAAGMGNIADANLTTWPIAIKKVIKKFPDPQFIIPGHQSWQSKDALKHTLHLLKQSKKK